MKHPADWLRGFQLLQKSHAGDGQGLPLQSDEGTESFQFGLVKLQQWIPPLHHILLPVPNKLLPSVSLLLELTTQITQTLLYCKDVCRDDLVLLDTSPNQLQV